jgi:hypothetical protein
VCGHPASWLLIERSVLFHVCDGHLAEQRKEWLNDEALFREVGMTFVTEFLPVTASATCGFRLPGPLPGTPGPACGAAAGHVEVETDRHYYCEADRPE